MNTRRIVEGSRLAVVRLLGVLIAFVVASPALATQLVPSRSTAAPGDSVTITVRPPLASTMSMGTRLVLHDARGRSLELGMREWAGHSFVAVVPCHARSGSQGVLNLLTDADDGRGHRIAAVIASSERDNARTRLFNVDSAGRVTCTDRLQKQTRNATSRQSDQEGWRAFSPRHFPTVTNRR